MHFHEICSSMYQEYLADIASADGLLPDSTKPYPEPMLITMYVTLWHH